MILTIILVDLIILYIVVAVLTTMAMRYIHKSRKIKNPIGLVLCFFLWPIWIGGVVSSVIGIISQNVASMLSSSLMRPATPSPAEALAKAMAAMTVGNDGPPGEETIDTEYTDISNDIDQVNMEE